MSHQIVSLEFPNTFLEFEKHCIHTHKIKNHCKFVPVDKKLESNGKDSARLKSVFLTEIESTYIKVLEN